ncbi:LytR/AlgR family response regulator transcription factor [Fonticella tunisiensis]|uniref:Stage 0 sporulation protein A homolog n=1 Tax=Fonticella tunisiensis TaxID=1096341 RepID=A0A4R7KNV5_9CLOT|nr:LytTR family DNA-binding domain-containing protein [Fonticella tunisiensis]TDT58380.1 LytTR family two component transcriptional regulator [Fonticella tunisiensis]
MANILVVEDDKVQRCNLVKMLLELGENFNILEAACANDAMKISRNNKIDLFYIDVNLPDFSGVDLAYEIRKLPQYGLSWIVFITTFADYMIDAFKKIHCYDYIIKLYDKKLVKEMTIKLTRNTVNRESIPKKERDYITLDIKGIFIKVYLDEIIFVEVFIRECTFHTINGKYKVNNLSLKKIMVEFNYL